MLVPQKPSLSTVYVSAFSKSCLKYMNFADFALKKKKLDQISKRSSSPERRDPVGNEH